MKDRSDDPSHHERTFLPRSYISLLGTRNSSMGPPWRIDPMTHRTMSEHSYHGARSRSLEREIAQWVHPMKDRFDDPSHHEWTLLPRSYISLHHEGSIRRPIAPWANALTTELHLAPPWRINPTTHRIMSERSYHGATSRSTMKDQSDDPSHHERTLLPRSYISLHNEGSIWRPIAPWANATSRSTMTHRTMSERSYHRATWRRDNLDYTDLLDTFEGYSCPLLSPCRTRGSLARWTAVSDCRTHVYARNFGSLGRTSPNTAGRWTAPTPPTCRPLKRRNGRQCFI